MTQAVHSTPRTPRGSARPPRASRTDLTARAAILGACLAMTAIVLLDLVDGRLDLLYSVGFVLIAVTPPMAVNVRQLLATGVLPPVLLIGSLLVVSIVQPDAIQVEGMAADAGTLARLIAATLDHGMTLLVGAGLAVVVIVLRIVAEPDRPTRSVRR